MTVKSRFSVIAFCLLVSPITLSIAEQHDSGDYFLQEDKGVILENSDYFLSKKRSRKVCD